MTSTAPIDLTDEPIERLSDARMLHDAYVFVDLEAVMWLPQKWSTPEWINFSDWERFVDNVTSASSTIIFFTTKESPFQKANMYALGIDHPVFIVSNKANVVKTLAVNHPVVFIDTSIMNVLAVRKELPDAETFWIMPEKETSAMENIFRFFNFF